MAFRKTFLSGLNTISKSYTAKSLSKPTLLSSETALSPRFLHQDLTGSSSAASAAITMPVGEKLMDKIRVLRGERLQLGSISPPPHSMTQEEVRKVLKMSKMEKVKMRLRAVKAISISYSQFVQICCSVDGDVDGTAIAKDLDQSGAVLVIGDVVFLNPELVARVIESVIPTTADAKTAAATTDIGVDMEDLRQEFEYMKQEKSLIDSDAIASVRRELWGGLGFLVVQTLGFMKLTFWDLSWDVMEPICFYVTSVYFMAGYAFFLRTSKDPSFEGFFESRFASRQKRLMEKRGFDVRRWTELNRKFGCPEEMMKKSSSRIPLFNSHCHRIKAPSMTPAASSSSSYCDCQRRDGDVLGIVDCR